MVDGVAQTYRPTPVLAHDGNALDLETLDETGDQLDVPFQRTGRLIGGLIRQAEPHQVGRDTTVSGGHQRLDHLAVQVVPRGLTMDQQNGRAGAFVHLVEPNAVDHLVVFLKHGSGLLTHSSPISMVA